MGRLSATLMLDLDLLRKLRSRLPACIYHKSLVHVYHCRKELVLDLLDLHRSERLRRLFDLRIGSLKV